MEFTTRFGLHSQATRLQGQHQLTDRHAILQALHPLWEAPFKGDLEPQTDQKGFVLNTTVPCTVDAADSVLGSSLSLAVTRGILLVSFPPLTDMLKFSGYSRLI